MRLVKVPGFDDFYINPDVVIFVVAAHGPTSGEPGTRITPRGGEDVFCRAPLADVVAALNGGEDMDTRVSEHLRKTAREFDKEFTRRVAVEIERDAEIAAAARLERRVENMGRRLECLEKSASAGTQSTRHQDTSAVSTDGSGTGGASDRLLRAKHASAEDFSQSRKRDLRAAWKKGVQYGLESAQRAGTTSTTTTPAGQAPSGGAPNSDATPAGQEENRTTPSSPPASAATPQDGTRTTAPGDASSAGADDSCLPTDADVNKLNALADSVMPRSALLWPSVREQIAVGFVMGRKRRAEGDDITFEEQNGMLLEMLGQAATKEKQLEAERDALRAEAEKTQAELANASGEIARLEIGSRETRKHRDAIATELTKARETIQSLKSNDWHKIAEQRSAEIVRLTEELERAKTTRRSPMRLEDRGWVQSQRGMWVHPGYPHRCPKAFDVLLERFAQAMVGEALEKAARIAERHASVAIYTGPCVETAAEIRALKEAECDSGDGLGASSSALDAASAADQRTPVLAQERGRCAAGLQSKPASAEVPHADPAPSDGRGCDEQPRRVEAPGSTDTAAGDVLCVNCGLPGARAHPPWENAWHDERNECIRLLRSALATAKAERDRLAIALKSHQSELARVTARAEKAEAERDEAVEAILGVRHGDCWCGMGIGHPSFSTHNQACIRAAAVVKGGK